MTAKKNFTNLKVRDEKKTRNNIIMALVKIADLYPNYKDDIFNLLE